MQQLGDGGSTSKRARAPAPAQEQQQEGGGGDQGAAAPLDLAGVMRSPGGSRIWGALGRDGKRALRSTSKNLLSECDALITSVSIDYQKYIRSIVEESHDEDEDEDEDEDDDDIAAQMLETARWATSRSEQLSKFSWEGRLSRSHTASLVHVLENAPKLTHLDLKLDDGYGSPALDLRDPDMLWSVVKLDKLKLVALSIWWYDMSSISTDQLHAGLTRLGNALRAIPTLAELVVIGFHDDEDRMDEVDVWALVLAGLKLTHLAVRGLLGVSPEAHGSFGEQLGLMKGLQSLTLTDVALDDEVTQAAVAAGLAKGAGATLKMLSMLYKAMWSTSAETLNTWLQACPALLVLDLSGWGGSRLTGFEHVIDQIARMPTLVAVYLSDLDNERLLRFANVAMPNLPHLSRLGLGMHWSAAADKDFSALSSVAHRFTALEHISIHAECDYKMKPPGPSLLGFCSSLLGGLLDLSNPMSNLEWLEIVAETSYADMDWSHAFKAVLAAIIAGRKSLGHLPRLRRVRLASEDEDAGSVLAGWRDAARSVRGVEFYLSYYLRDYACLDRMRGPTFCTA